MPAGDRFQNKIDKIFKYLPNSFGITGNIYIVDYDYDGKGHDRTLRPVMQICYQQNLKLNKNKCHFRCMRVPFVGKIISK